MITFHLVKLGSAFMTALGRALTAAQEEAEMRWLVFRSCDIGGDLGLRAITPYLCKLPLQVLAIEACKLTDASWRYLASILKARENSLDDLYWNSTLRADPNDINADKLSEGDKEVLGEGLVALSLCGNLFAGTLSEDFARVLKKSYWLLGLNLADNQLREDRYEEILASVRSNDTLQTILLRGNTACAAENIRNLYHVMASKEGQLRRDEKAAALNSGYARLDLLPIRIAWLLRTWMRLQSVEAMGDSREDLSSDDARAYSCLSYCLESPEEGVVDHGVSENGVVSGKKAQEAAVLYDLATDHVGQAATIRRMADGPFHDLLFAPERGDSVADVSDGAAEEAEEVNDYLDHGLPVRAPIRQSNGWEYWPEARPSHSYDHRPPSRISMRPKSAPPSKSHQDVRPSRSRNDSPLPRYMQPKGVSNRHARDSIVAINRKLRTVSSSPPRLRNAVNGVGSSPPKQRPWVPAAVYSPPRVRPDSRKQSNVGTSYVADSAIKKSMEDIHENHERSHSRPITRMKQTRSIEKERRSSPQKVKEVKSSAPATGSKKKKVKKHSPSALKDPAVRAEMEALTALSTSVLAATKNLEHVSKRLRHVAQSLSESAVMNLSSSALTPAKSSRRSFVSRYDESTDEDGLMGAAAVVPMNESVPQQSRRATKETSDSTHRAGRAQVVPTDFGDLSFTSSLARSSMEGEQQMQLAELVRQRMQSKLRNILQHEVAMSMSMN
eukprot:scaffold5398_cov240-Ochromonas_danica.AAC.3